MSTGLVEIIRCPCRKLISAHSHPSCNTSKEWKEDCSYYKIQRCEVVQIPEEYLEFKFCNCGDVKRKGTIKEPKKALTLF